MSTSRNTFILFFTTFILASFASNAQRSGNDEEPSRWFVGGNIGLQFGYVTLIDVSPIIGYNISDRFAVGTGLTYKYYRIRNYFYDPYLNSYRHFRSHIYGGPVFSRFYISRQIFAHAEYEFLRFRNEVYVQNTAGQSYDRHYQNINVHSMFVGGGYRQYFSRGSAFEIMLLWNLNETPNSPYNNPVIRMGFSIGL
jgi:hypothetical protein